MIFINRVDGGVSVMHLVGDADVNIALERWKDVHPGEYVSHSAGDTVPADRTFRDGWILNAGAVTHDMVRCRNIWKDRMREARTPKLTALDGQWNKAMGAKRRAELAGDNTTAAQRQAEADQIEDKRQALRDVTALPAITSAKTTDDLKAVWPDALK